MKKEIGFTENSQSSGYTRYDYAKLFKKERDKREAEAASMPPLGATIVIKIAEEQAIRQKKHMYRWIAAALCLLLIGLATLVLLPQTPIGDFSGLQSAFLKLNIQITGWITGLSNSATSVTTQIIAIRESTVTILKQTISEIIQWPFHIWYIILLAAGVAMLMYADHLQRHRKII